MCTATYPPAFQWVMVAASSSSLTIGEHNKNTDMCRAAAWVIFVSLPPIFIAASAASAYIIMYNGEPIWGTGLPWRLSVVMLWGVYMAVVELAMWHLTLFLPRAPFAAIEALRHVGLDKIGLTLGVTSALVLCFGPACILWSCIVSVLIAAILSFWICLVRTYGE